jgi:hypothetical protein
MYFPAKQLELVGCVDCVLCIFVVAFVELECIDCCSAVDTDEDLRSLGGCGEEGVGGFLDCVEFGIVDLGPSS